MAAVTSFNIKGERCSGTNYLQKLIETNLNIDWVQQCNGGWKHGYFSLFGHHRDLPSTFLTVIMFRNPFDWVRSIYLKPHHLKNANGEKLQLTFSEFIRSEVNQFNRDGVEIHLDRHPLTFQKAKNILELRKWKIQNYLNIKNVLPNTYYLRYEDLAENPEKIITEINDTFFNADFKFQNWTKYKHCNAEYQPKKYFSISDEDRSFIIENLDWELESKIGYTPN